jgi:hypothetical protein
MTQNIEMTNATLHRSQILTTSRFIEVSVVAAITLVSPVPVTGTGSGLAFPACTGEHNGLAPGFRCKSQMVVVVSF